jgi:hypothetical protein
MSFKADGVTATQQVWRKKACIKRYVRYVTSYSITCMPALQEAIKPNGASYMTKAQLINTITARLNIHMADQQGGFGRWNNIKSLERKGWVARDA